MSPPRRQESSTPPATPDATATSNVSDATGTTAAEAVERTHSSGADDARGSTRPTAVPRTLRWRWWLTAGVVVVAAVAAAFVVSRAFGLRAGGLWLLASAPVFGYLLWFLFRALPWNHPPAAADPPAVAPTLGLANGVTLGRGWLYAAVAGFLLVVPPTDSAFRWLPVLCYGGGAALDWVDGALARTVGRRSVLGEKLDMAFDTVGFLVAPLVGVVWGRLPLWYLSISVARYLFKAGRGWRRIRGRPVYDLPPSRVRRPLAGLQMAFITAALLPVVPVGVVEIAAAAVVTPSLAVFVRDYLVVTGRLRAPSKTTSAVDRPRTPPDR
jgi:CDP-diacylglycerol--glycerol-3-phosphate 3-phosphatidyltransferase